MFATLSRLAAAVALAVLAVLLLTHGGPVHGGTVHANALSAAAIAQPAPCNDPHGTTHDASYPDSVRPAPEESTGDLLARWASVPLRGTLHAAKAIPAATRPPVVFDAASTVIRLGVLIR